MKKKNKVTLMIKIFFKNKKILYINLALIDIN